MGPPYNAPPKECINKIAHRVNDEQLSNFVKKFCRKPSPIQNKYNQVSPYSFSYQSYFVLLIKYYSEHIIIVGVLNYR